MKLVVGLGNPGRQYTETRHNIGFRVVEQIANTSSGGTWSARFDGLTCDIRLGAEKLLLLKPMTYMNRSGRSVRSAIDFYKVELADLLIICDDVNLSLGKLRLRSGGSAGGNNGLKDIILHLGTEEFPRLRVGVGAPRPGRWWIMFSASLVPPRKGWPATASLRRVGRPSDGAKRVWRSR